MITQSPGRLILIGVLLMLFGVIVPIMMVLRVIPSTFLLNFLSYGASVGGLFLGLIGLATFVRRR